MHCQNSQSKVSHNFFVLNVINVLVAVIQEAIRHCIPQIIDFMWNRNLFVRRAGADALLKLSEQGNVLIF